MKKKFILGLGAITTVTSPIAALVSCGNDDKGVEDYNELDNALETIKTFVKSTKTDAELKAVTATKDSVINNAATLGLLFTKLKSGVTREVTVRRDYSVYTKTIALKVKLTYKGKIKTKDVLVMAKDGGGTAIGLFKLLDYKGLLKLPVLKIDKKDGDKLSLEEIILDLANQEKGHLGEDIAGILKGNYSMVIDIISDNREIMTLLSKIIKGGLSSLNNNDINAIKELVGKILGDNGYKGDNALISAIVNGVQDEEFDENGSPVKLMNTLKGLVTKLIPPALKKSIDKILGLLVSKATGTWEYFFEVNNNTSIYQEVDNIQVSNDIKELAKIKLVEDKVKKINAFASSNTDQILPILNEFKKMLSAKDSAIDNSRKVLTSISHMKTLPEFKGKEEALNLYNLKIGEPLVEITNDNLIDFIKISKDIINYYNSNKEKILSDSLTSSWENLIKFTAIYKNVFNSYENNQDNYLKTYIKWTMAKLKVSKLDELKEAVKRNIVIIRDIRTLSMLSGKNIFSPETYKEFKRSIAYLQSVVQKLLIYFVYEKVDLMKTFSGIPQAAAILSNPALWKIATIDISKVINTSIFNEDDYAGIADILKMLIGDKLEIQFTKNDIESVFTFLINGMNGIKDPSQNFKNAMTKIAKIIPGLGSLSSQLIKILFGA